LNLTPTFSKPLPRLRSGAQQLLALVVIGAVGGAEIPSTFHRFSIEHGGYFFTLDHSGPAVVAALDRLLCAFLRRIGLDLFVATSRTVALGIRVLLLTRTSCPSSLQNAVSRHRGRAKEQQQYTRHHGFHLTTPNRNFLLDIENAAMARILPVRDIAKGYVTSRRQMPIEEKLLWIQNRRLSNTAHCGGKPCQNKAPQIVSEARPERVLSSPSPEQLLSERL
jgi:hypothetical protein